MRSYQRNNHLLNCRSNGFDNAVAIQKTVYLSLEKRGKLCYNKAIEINREECLCYLL